MTDEPPTSRADSSTTTTAEKAKREGAPQALRGRARALALEMAAEARAEWAYTSDVIARAFRTHRELGSSERRMVAEAVYGLVRWDRRLDAIVDQLVQAGRRGRKEAPSAIARDALKLVVYELRQGVQPELETDELRKWLRPEVPLERVVEQIVADDAGLGDAQGIEREALRRSYPSWLLERFVEDLGEEGGHALADAMNRRAPMAVRANTVKVSADELVARLADEGVAAHRSAITPAGVVLDTRVNAFGLRSFQDGLFEVMDEGSQLVGEAVAPPPRGRVVDACAGAGGKTLALGALMEGQGRLLALDVSGKKLEELRRRARRAGLSNVTARAIENAAMPAEAKLGAWDRVLVDAPCSGLGTLRRNPEARWRLSPREVDSFPARQLALMVEYAPLVAVGGRLIYATCTVLSTENERVVERFLAERPEFVVMPLKDIFGKERAERLGNGFNLRLYPHQHDTDGFFAAILRRVR